MIRCTNRARQFLSLGIMFAVAACGRRQPPRPPEPAARPAHSIVPVPASLQLVPADTFVVDSATTVLVSSGGGAEAERIGGYLAYMLAGPAARLARTLLPEETATPNTIQLSLDPAKTSLGQEGYELIVARDRVTLVAAAPNGLFYGVQTIRQLLPWSIEHRGALNRRLRMPGVRITDSPRAARCSTCRAISSTPRR
jgi:hexosaminidase